VVDAGILTGARNVVVNGTLYDVDFVDGTCVELFSGCDAASDFPFRVSGLAVAASQALLDFVFIDGPAGSFDSDTRITRGCSLPTVCRVDTPRRSGTDVAGNLAVTVAYAFNGNGRAYVDVAGYGVSFLASADKGLAPEQVYAVWTSVVPEPHAWSYLAAGLPLVMSTLSIEERHATARW
jgi:hypothetical protein